MKRLSICFALVLGVLVLLESCDDQTNPITGNPAQNDSTSNEYANFLRGKEYSWEKELVLPSDDKYSEWLDKYTHTCEPCDKLTHRMQIIGEDKQKASFVETFDRYYTHAYRYIGSDDSPIYRYPEEDWQQFDTTYHMIEKDTVPVNYQIQYPSISFTLETIRYSNVTVVGIANYYEYNKMLWDSRYPPHGEFITPDSITCQLYGVANNKVDTISRTFVKQ